MYKGFRSSTSWLSVQYPNTTWRVRNKFFCEAPVITEEPIWGKGFFMSLFSAVVLDSGSGWNHQKQAEGEDNCLWGVRDWDWRWNWWTPSHWVHTEKSSAGVPVALEKSVFHSTSASAPWFDFVLQGRIYCNHQSMAWGLKVCETHCPCLVKVFQSPVAVLRCMIVQSCFPYY